ncbi:nitrite reductase [Nocardioides acrostichi]|uniref:Nitrite reductase n=1 Tax=Nocardioides acrostichi TaxID=2784339 RepID=A0A930V0Z7_9ACTN|nr:nitrite reductase [Nocardioides acrostichi]MBF4162685.1 nitrite reductase [Nocardioides acrostichi]
MEPESEDLLALAATCREVGSGFASGPQTSKDSRVAAPPASLSDARSHDSERVRPDRCPGLFRPWPADDGLLVRLRVPGGRVSRRRLRALLEVAQRWGDGSVHVTSRANLQVRGLPSDGGPAVRADVRRAVLATGLVPHPTHELVRNVLASPLTGLAGGRADLGPVVDALDAALCADPRLAELPGRFLFVLDDGRGDLADQRADLGAVALDPDTAQLRVGDGWGERLALADLPRRACELARRFLDVRGPGRAAPWHVRELPAPLAEPSAPDSRALVRSAPPEPGPTPAGVLVALPDARLDAHGLAALDEAAGPDGDEVRVTPWSSVLVPGATGAGR